MADNTEEIVWGEFDEDAEELPDLDTEEGRDQWVEILMAQDDESLAAHETGWCKALVVADEQGNMVVRFVYPDGGQEVFDLQVRRAIEVSLAPEERN